MIPRFGQITFEIGCEFQTNTQGHETFTKSSNYAISIGSSLKIQAKYEHMIKEFEGLLTYG